MSPLAELLRRPESTALRASLAELTARHSAAAAELRPATKTAASSGTKRGSVWRDSAPEKRSGARPSTRSGKRAAPMAWSAAAWTRPTTRSASASPPALRALDARRAELEHLRAERSRQLWQQIARDLCAPECARRARPVGALFLPSLRPEERATAPRPSSSLTPIATT